MEEKKAIHYVFSIQQQTGHGQTVTLNGNVPEGMSLKDTFLELEGLTGMLDILMQRNNYHILKNSVETHIDQLKDLDSSLSVELDKNKGLNYKNNIQQMKANRKTLEGTIEGERKAMDEIRKTLEEWGLSA